MREAQPLATLSVTPRMPNGIGRSHTYAYRMVSRSGRQRGWRQVLLIWAVTAAGMAYCAAGFWDMFISDDLTWWDSLPVLLTLAVLLALPLAVVIQVLSLRAQRRGGAVSKERPKLTKRQQVTARWTLAGLLLLQSAFLAQMTGEHQSYWPHIRYVAGKFLGTFMTAGYACILIVALRTMRDARASARARALAAATGEESPDWRS